MDIEEAYILQEGDHYYFFVKRKRTDKANAAGESSSFIFTVCVKSVPLYHFKLSHEALHMAVKEFFESHFQKWRNKPF